MTRGIELKQLIFKSLFIIFIVSCGPTQEEQTEKQSDMASLLQSKKEELNLLESPYIVDENVIKNIRARTQTKDKGKSLEARFFLARNLLFYGEPEEAIKELESVQTDLSRWNVALPPQQAQVFYNTLGLSYLRLGEELNCLNNSNEATCIIPIEKEGIHTIQSASEAAITAFSTALQYNPSNYESVWFLNLAHMTLGTWPEGVPEQFRIPESKFQNEQAFQKFRNEGIKRGIGDNRLSGGCVIDDFNNDGQLDIMASSWGFDDALTVYINQGTGKFKDESSQPGLKGITGGLNLVPTDFNNDGNIDILVLRGAWLGERGCVPNSLLKGNGDGTFEDVTLQAGLTGSFPTQTAVWTDIDLDGNIDLFIGNETQKNEQFACEFYYNNGDGTFKEMAAPLGLNANCWSKGVSAGDVNNDGYPDIYLSNHNGDNFLFVHNGEQDISKIKFTDQAESYAVAKPFCSFSTWFFDFNQDGLDDIFVVDYGNLPIGKNSTFVKNLMGEKLEFHPRIYINNGKGKFEDISEKAGMTDVVYAMGSNFGDLNFDGYPDFYLSTGSPSFDNIFPNKMYLNKNGESVADISYSGGFGHLQKGHAVGFADIDNDGDQDVYNVIGGAFLGDNFNNALFVNPGTKNNFLYVSLEGSSSNSAGIGSRIEVYSTLDTGEKHIFRKTSNWGGSFGCSPIGRQEIGIGRTETIDSVKVYWANKPHSIEVFKNVQPNSWIKLKEGSERAVKESLKIHS
jgi:hypothetical protein